MVSEVSARDTQNEQLINKELGINYSIESEIAYLNDKFIAY